MSVYVQSTLINMYGKCNDIEKFVATFKIVCERSLECQNPLTTYLFQNSMFKDVVEVFSLEEGLGFDEVTLSSTLKVLSIFTFANLFRS